MLHFCVVTQLLNESEIHIFPQNFVIVYTCWRENIINNTLDWRGDSREFYFRAFSFANLEFLLLSPFVNRQKPG